MLQLPPLCTVWCMVWHCHAGGGPNSSSVWPSPSNSLLWFLNVCTYCCELNVTLICENSTNKILSLSQMPLAWLVRRYGACLSPIPHSMLLQQWTQHRTSVAPSSHMLLRHLCISIRPEPSEVNNSFTTLLKYKCL